LNPPTAIAERGRPLGSPLSVWFHFRLVPLLGALLVKLLAYTLRVKVEGGEPVAELIHADRRIVLAFWHRRLLMMPLSYPWKRVAADGTDRGVAILSSDSKDGERSAATWRHFGIHAVRGTASEDGARALVRMIRAVKDGWDFGITPDGPRGPRQVLKPGVVALARRTGAWVVPVTVAYSSQVELRTWDALPIPLPFATAVVRYGEPYQVEPGADETTEGQRLEALMNQLERCAEASLHG
jgi:lysophospholipid acyltransferase (LPLAT)-like uncharacterized protein